MQLAANICLKTLVRLRARVEMIEPQWIDAAIKERLDGVLKHLQRRRQLFEQMPLNEIFFDMPGFIGRLKAFNYPVVMVEPLHKVLLAASDSAYELLHLQHDYAGPEWWQAVEQHHRDEPQQRCGSIRYPVEHIRVSIICTNQARVDVVMEGCIVKAPDGNVYHLYLLSREKIKKTAALWQP